MSVAETMAKLSIRTLNLTNATGHGRPELSGEEIAAGLAGLHPSRAALLLAKYAGDEYSERQLQIMYRVEITRIAVRLQYRTPDLYRGKEPLLRLSDLVVREALHPAHCQTCHGAGVDPEQATCPNCTGSGFHYASDVERADLIGVTHAWWCRLYREMHAQAATQLAMWESDALSHAWRRLFGSEE